MLVITREPFIVRSGEDMPLGPELHLREGLTLLDHDVLPFWPEDWVVVERERHRQARLHSLEQMSDILCEAGHYDQALRAGLASVAGEPLRESAHLRVIRVHLAEHNQGEVLRQFEMYRQLLHEELGLEPSAQLRRLLGGT